MACPLVSPAVTVLRATVMTALVSCLAGEGKEGHHRSELQGLRSSGNAGHATQADYLHLEESARCRPRPGWEVHLQKGGTYG